MQIVDGKDPRLNTIRAHLVQTSLPFNVQVVDIGHDVHHFRDRDIPEPKIDVGHHIRMHHYVVTGAVDQGLEKGAGFNAPCIDIETFLPVGLRRQRRQQCGTDVRRRDGSMGVGSRGTGGA